MDWGTTAGQHKRSQRNIQAEQGTLAWVRTTAVAAFIVAVSAFAEHRPCSQHATISTKHSAPWHCLPALRGQLDG